MNIVSEGIPRWKSGGILYRLFFICMVAVFYPFTAVIRICAPDSYIGRMAAKPLIKFINSVASFVTLLGKLVLPKRLVWWTLANSNFSHSSSSQWLRHLLNLLILWSDEDSSYILTLLDLVLNGYSFQYSNFVISIKLAVNQGILILLFVININFIAFCFFEFFWQSCYQEHFSTS